MAGGRQRSELWGRRAEVLAALYLRLKGYSILDRRVSLMVGELDIVARRGATYAFVEVKARRSVEDGLNAVTHISRQRIERAAAAWLSRRNILAEFWRYDIIVVRPWRIPVHIADAWRPDI